MKTTILLLLLALLLVPALSAQQVIIEAEYTTDLTRSYERISGRNVFRCDGHRWTVSDIVWPTQPGRIKNVMLVNDTSTFGVSLERGGAFTAYLLTPGSNLQATIATGKECFKGTIAP
jgi:hypothetical protein